MTNERDKAFMATVALHPHGQIWFYARFPKSVGKLAANLLRDDHDVPQTNNLKLGVAAHILKRRHQG